MSVSANSQKLDINSTYTAPVHSFADISDLFQNDEEKEETRNCSDCFGIIYKYMKSDYRRYMDMGNPLYLCKTPKQIMGNMGITVDLNAEISNTYDEFILEWMSDCYITLQWKYRLWSSEIIDIVKPEKLYKQYYPLHETSLTNAVTKIYEIYHLNYFRIMI